MVSVKLIWIFKNGLNHIEITLQIFIFLGNLDLQAAQIKATLQLIILKIEGVFKGFRSQKSVLFHTDLNWWMGMEDRLPIM